MTPFARQETHVPTDISETNGNLPAQNIEAEKAVLGAILIAGGEGGKPARVRRIIGPEDFYRARHRVIFDAMISLSERNEPIELLTVVNALKKMGKLDEARGPSFEGAGAPGAGLLLPAVKTPAARGRTCFTIRT